MREGTGPRRRVSFTHKCRCSYRSGACWDNTCDESFIGRGQAFYVLQNGTSGSLNISERPITKGAEDDHWIGLLTRKNTNTKKMS